MSEANGKVCCNCRHYTRNKEDKRIMPRCDLNNDYLSYFATFHHWCRHWARERSEQ